MQTSIRGSSLLTLAAGCTAERLQCGVVLLCLQELQIDVAQKNVSPETVDRCMHNDHCGPQLLAWISDLLSSDHSKGANSALTKTGNHFNPAGSPMQAVVTRG